jgi:hypothetical protein
MTPEERLTRTENMIKALSESQVHHEAMIEKQNAAIRDLIVVSRTVLDSQKHTGNQILKLSDQVQALSGQVQEFGKAQKRTEDNVSNLASKDKSAEGRIRSAPPRIAI